MGTSAPSDSDGSLLDAARALVAAAAADLRPDAAPVLDELRATLGRELRIAVAGRVSAGKSTLVNALLGRRVAPTAAGECTRVVTWYRYGSPDRADLVLKDGSTRSLPMGDGLPERLGVPADDVARIEVRLQSAPLRRYALVDTPGLGGLGRPDDAAARAAVHGDGDARGADAVLFLFRDVEKLDDLEFVTAYRRAVGEAEAAAVTVVGVLSHADLVGDGPWGDADPFAAARELTERMSRDHAAHFSAVLPVAGLLAEAARTNGLTEADARGLAALRGTDRVRLQIATRRPLADPAAAEAVARTLAVAGPYVLDRGREIAAGSGATGLREWLEDRSGIAALESVVAHRFAQRSGPLKVATVVTRLERLARTHAVDGAARRRLTDRLEAFRLDPRAHRMAELTALADLAGERDGGGDLRRQLAQVVDSDEPWRRLGCAGPRSPAELRPLALQLAARATAAATLARTPTRARAARVLSRSYLLIADRI